MNSPVSMPVNTLGAAPANPLAPANPWANAKALGPDLAAAGDEIERRRHRQALRRWRDAQRCVASARDERAHPITDAPAPNALPQCSHDAGDLESRNVARTRRRRIVPTPLQHIGAIHARRRNTNQDFATARNRVGAFGWCQDPWPAWRTDLDADHVSALLSLVCRAWWVATAQAFVHASHATA